MKCVSLKLVLSFAIPAVFLVAAESIAQSTDYVWVPDPTVEAAPYTLGSQRGARQVSGPYDLDGDEKVDILVSDYSGGGRVHVLESTGQDTWELVYSSPVLEAGNGTTENLRTVTGADLDGDGMGEIVAFAGAGLSDDNPLVVAGILKRGLYVIEATGDNEFAGVAARTGQYLISTASLMAAQTGGAKSS